MVDSDSDDRRDGEPGAARSRPSRPGGRPAAFLDRDGTIIEAVHYLSDPRSVRLLPGAAEAIRRLRAAGLACVVVTNQSAIGRGMFSEERLDEIHDELERQLAAEGTELDAIYFCPEVPGTSDLAQVEYADRKPGPGMLFRAAEALGLDLDASWMVGDMLSDVHAGINARCRGSILVRTGKGSDPAATSAHESSGVAYHVADDLLAAAEWILAGSAVDQPHA